MLKQLRMGLRAFLLLASKIWNCFCFMIKKQTRAIIQHQSVKYDLFPLSPLSRHRLSIVKRKVLVLDLDETLIHSHHDGVVRQTVRPGTPPDFVLKVVIDRHPVRFFVHKRPHVDFFLDIVSQWYELVVFTASMEIYGAAVADKLDAGRGILQRRFYRQHCTPDLGSYTKDLSAICNDLSSVFILDNSPGAYRAYPDNAIPIKSWFSDPSDTALLNLLPVLDALRFTADVRSVLSRNLHLHRLCGVGGGGGGATVLSAGGGVGVGGGVRPTTTTTTTTATTDVTFYRQLLCKFQRTDEVVTANNGKFIADHVVTQVQEHDKSV